MFQHSSLATEKVLYQIHECVCVCVPVSAVHRMFNCTGEEVNRLQFTNGGNYTAAVREGSFEIFGDRFTKLGTNM